jgi:hypothetical protein
MKLNYCYSSAPSLCIVSFGKDQTGSSLIVLRNGNPAWKQLFLKVKQTDILQISVCQQVQFSNDVYYCTVPTLLEGTDVQIGVYVADTSLLVASGLIRVSFGATPGAKESETPASQYATATFQEPTQIFTPTPATRLSPTRVPTKARTPSYPNP